MDSETFVMYVAIRKQKKMPEYFKRQAQVEALPFDKAPIEVLAEYSDYSNVFLVENTVKLLKYIGINDYVIKLEKGK